MTSKESSADVAFLSSPDIAKFSTAEDLSPLLVRPETSELMTNFTWKHSFSEIWELPVTQFGKEIKLKAYRFPPKHHRKAVIFYIHGYGSYIQKNACLSKYLADYDFEIFAIDQRGFGDSEGERVLVESVEEVYNDQWLLVFEAIKRYNIDQ